jgi:large subunit ribosomal protein L6
MTKVGNLPVKIPEGVTAEIEKNRVLISGPKGSLEVALPNKISVEEREGGIWISKKGEGIQERASQGTLRSLLNNMVKGVTEGWSKELEMVGTGYRAEVNDDELVLTIGFSHPVKIRAPKGISFKVEKTKITVEGVDKQVVGQVASDIRAVRPPEPYKGKGIRYVDEVVRRKAGKAAKAQGAA